MYKGARFYKCDLQMQTPADAPHWLDDDLDITSDPERAAKIYIQHCYEAKLEVIAITDHNFKSKTFIPLLKDAARKLSSNYGYEIVIFPGFEITAKIGKGVHALCIFESTADLEQIDHILTDCGVPMPRTTPTGANKPAECDLQKLLRIIQKKTDQGTLQGLVILPHSQSDAGIFDNDRVSEWLQQAEFTNKDLLCLEVPKSPAHMSAGWQKLLFNGKDCLSDWKRDRAISCIMSSDAKAIKQKEGITNFIGSRYTWIKMSRPTIEGLRQAFLDHDSRIRRGDEYPKNPDEAYTHPYIKSIAFLNAKFLADQKIVFGPTLNTIIGGRGTGKSTVVEYLRIGLGRTNEVLPEIKNSIEGIRKTLKHDSKIIIEYNKGAGFDQKWSLESTGGDAPFIVTGSQTPSIKDFFPVRILSKNQIEAITKSLPDQIKIIDALIRTKLSDLQNTEQEIYTSQEAINLKLSKESELREIKKILEAQIQDLEGTIKHIEHLSEPMKEWALWDEERRYLSSLSESAATVSKVLSEATRQFTDSSQALSQDLPNRDWLLKQSEKFAQLLKELNAEIAASEEKFKNGFDQISADSLYKEWQTKFQEKEMKFESVSSSLKEKSIDPSQYKEYKDDIAIKKQRLADIDEELSAIEAARKKFNIVLYKELRPLWNEQSELRKAAAQKLNDQVPQTEDGKPSVLVSVVQYGDFKAFKDYITTNFRGDGRRVSDADWEEFLSGVCDLSRIRNEPPSFTLENWITTLRQGNRPDGCSIEPADKKATALIEWFGEHQLNKAKIYRTPDSIRVELYRMEDGSLVGDLESGSLSAGQKATTILALTLARGNSPIVIDQPEDDLDNEFVYKQLVPLLRARKEHRQIIVVSHNANIPVNGDSELIVPLEVKTGRGQQKELNGISAVGALDRRETQFSVEQIMEGSAEAFRKRMEKYGF